MPEFTSPYMRKALSKIGAKIILEPEYGYVGEIIFSNGKRSFFHRNDLEINSLASSTIAKDKAYTKYFLKKFGYNVLEGKAFYSNELNNLLKKNQRGIDQGYGYAKKLGFPLILKPNSLSHGILVKKVHDKKEYYAIAKRIFNRNDVMLIERFYNGDDFRIVVFDGKIISAYQRIPLSVIGDGKSTIRKLLEDKQKRFEKEKRDTKLDLNDFRIKMNLLRNNLSLDSILGKEKKLFLLDNSNLSTGGESIDVTGKIHDDYINLALRITKDMGLRLCGIDLMAKGDIAKKLSDYVIIEINASPGLDNYAFIGKKQQRIVEELYLGLFKAIQKK